MIGVNAPEPASLSAGDPPHKKAPGLAPGALFSSRKRCLSADRYADLRDRRTNWRFRIRGDYQLDPGGVLVPEIGGLARLAQCVQAVLLRPGPELAKPGSSKITHESLFISLKLKETSGLSVFTWISVPARSVLWLPVMWKSLPLRLRTMGGWAAAPCLNNRKPLYGARRRPLYLGYVTCFSYALVGIPEKQRPTSRGFLLESRHAFRNPESIRSPKSAPGKRSRALGRNTALP